ncbi:MAG: ABC transporter permease [Gordonia sp. (in: high G+C Gram-positive bacteria)]
MTGAIYRDAEGLYPTPARAAQPSKVQQWWVLTSRNIVPTLRNGELVTQIAASVMFTVGFYIPLKKIGANASEMSSYAQYLMPLIALQAISFAAISGAFRSASDKVAGINKRFRVMPISKYIPMTARLTASVYRATIALILSIICGYVIGFRFHNGALGTLGFCVVALAIGCVLSLFGEVIGASAKNPEATTHLMMLPQLIFGLLSVGVLGASAFPEWIRGFVRNQPISQFVYALRALAGDTTSAAGEVGWDTIGPAIAWLLGMFVFLVVAYIVVSARAAHR